MAIDLWQWHCRNRREKKKKLWQCHCHKSIATFFFFILNSSQISATTILLLLFFLPFLATWLPQLVNHLDTPLSMHWGTSRAELGQDKNFGNFISKIHFFLPPYHITHISSLLYFSYNFGNTIAKIQSLFSFCWITLNNAYNNNKLRFLHYLAKRLMTQVSKYF